MEGSSSKEAVGSIPKPLPLEKTSPPKEDLNASVTREKLLPALQKLVNDDTPLEQIYDGTYAAHSC